MPGSCLLHAISDLLGPDVILAPWLSFALSTPDSTPGLSSVATLGLVAEAGQARKHLPASAIAFLSGSVPKRAAKAHVTCTHPAALQVWAGAHSPPFPAAYLIRALSWRSSRLRFRGMSSLSTTPSETQAVRTLRVPEALPCRPPQGPLPPSRPPFSLAAHVTSNHLRVRGKQEDKGRRLSGTTRPQSLRVLTS